MHEKKLHNFTMNFCKGKMYPMTVPIFSAYTLVLPLDIPLQAHKHLIEKAGSFRKLLHLASIGMVKVMTGMDKDMLGKVNNFIGETYSLICLASQRLHPIDVTKYKQKSSVTTLDNELIVVITPCLS